MNITEDFIIQFAGNASAVSNGRSLAAKGSFDALAISGDGTLLFGACKGSGKNPYQCSVDFTDTEKPIPRCSCPSRQIPCKHVIGLLFCRLQNKTFTTQEIPEDITAKRNKAKQREEKKKEENTNRARPQALTKAKVSAAIKKCLMQLEGVSLAEKILHNILLAGLHSMDRKSEKMYADQVKELGNYYIGGIQASLLDVLMSSAAGQKEQNFSDAIVSVNRLYALLKKSKSYLISKIADYEAFPNMTQTATEAMLHSSIEEQLGYAWKLTELCENGLFREKEELVQVAFHCYEDLAKQQWVDEGLWMSLSGGDLFKTLNFRPFRAQKYIREEDSCFPTMMVEELFIYPGDKNPRVRWEHSQQRSLRPEDLQRLQTFAQADFTAVIKQVKAQIRSPLADKEPLYPLRVSRMVIDEEGNPAACDGKGTMLSLRLEKFGFLLNRLSREQVEGQMLICRFIHDVETGRLRATPVALVNDQAIVRFYY